MPSVDCMKFIQAKLNASYPTFMSLSDTQQALYLREINEALDGIDDDVCKAATMQINSDNTSNWAPSVGAFRSKAQELIRMASKSDGVDGYAAWGLAMNAVSKFGYTEGTPERLQAFFIERAGDEVGAQVMATVKRFGWRDICLADEDTLPTLRAQFRDTFNTIKLRDEKRQNVLPKVAQIMDNVALRLTEVKRPQLQGAK